MDRTQRTRLGMAGWPPSSPSIAAVAGSLARHSPDRSSACATPPCAWARRLHRHGTDVRPTGSTPRPALSTTGQRLGVLVERERRSGADASHQLPRRSPAWLAISNSCAPPRSVDRPA
jgi:hypothetical protein